MATKKYKKIFKLISLIIVLAGIFVFLNTRKTTVSYNLEGKNYKLLVADNFFDHERGLMHIRKKPRNIDGMIFLFPKKEKRIFWNKNTFVDLDVYWLDDDKIVGKNFLPSIIKSGNIVTITSTVPVNKVIEIIK